jgi:hypothetical protein
MRPQALTITPRTPLTLTELETLAVMLDNGTCAMVGACTPDGRRAWMAGLSDEWNDIFAGFYQLRDNTAVMICGQRMPWDVPEGQVKIIPDA